MVTPAKRGKGSRANKTQDQHRTPAERHAAMTPDQVRGRLWVQRLKRVFKIDIETCGQCGGAMKVIACTEEPEVIKKILAHIAQKEGVSEPCPLPESRAPPEDRQTSLFG